MSNSKTDKCAFHKVSAEVCSLSCLAEQVQHAEVICHHFGAVFFDIYHDLFCTAAASVLFVSVKLNAENLFLWLLNEQYLLHFHSFFHYGAVIT